MGKSFKCLVPLLLVTFALIFAARLIPTSTANPETRVYIDPPLVEKLNNETSVGDTFIVALKFDEMTDLAGIEYKIYWNNSVVNVVSVADTLPWSGAPFVAINETDNNYNATHGRMWFVAVSLSGSYSGSGTVRQITFNITSPAPTGSFLYSLIDIQDEIFGDSFANPIPHDTYDGEFYYYWIIPEFSGVAIFAVLLATTAVILVSVRYFKRGREFLK